MPDDRLPSLFEAAPLAASVRGDAGGDVMGGAAGGGPDDTRSGNRGAGGRRTVRPRPAKAPDALLTIGEVSAALAIRQHVLRYWEEQFPMLRPLKRSGARRYYRPDDVALVRRIDQLVHRDGYTLRGARLVLEGRGAEAAGELGLTAPAAGMVDTAPAIDRAPDLIGRLRAIRARLAIAAG